MYKKQILKPGFHKGRKQSARQNLVLTTMRAKQNININLFYPWTCVCVIAKTWLKV